MPKLCLIYNFAQHYRSEIFQLLDNSFDVDFYFGDKYLDVKKMDYSLLKGKVTEVHNGKIGPFLYQTKVLSLLWKYDTFLMIGETHSATTWLFMFLSKLFPKKHIYFWCHGWYGKETKVESFLKHILDKLPTGLFVYGNYAKRLMIKEGFNENKIHVIYNSLAYSEHLKIRQQITQTGIYKKHFGNEFPTLIMIGRLNLRKKIDMMFYAVQALKQVGKFFNVVLIGDGTDKDKLVKISYDCGIQDNVWFYGACYDEKVNAELLYNADLCVVPGDIGLTAIHSLTFGVPVITHNDFRFQGPEFEAIKPGVTGDFFQSGSVDSLIDSIQKWFESNSKNRDMVRKECFNEIDTNWNPRNQIDIFKKNIVFE